MIVDRVKRSQHALNAFFGRWEAFQCRYRRAYGQG